MSKRTLSLVAGCLLLAGACDSGPDWRERWTKMDNGFCETLYECADAATLQTTRTFNPEIGNDVDECKANHQARQANLVEGCLPGHTYDDTSAKQCQETWTTMTCQEFDALLGSWAPGCDTICVASQ